MSENVKNSNFSESKEQDALSLKVPEHAEAENVVTKTVCAVEVVHGSAQEDFALGAVTVAEKLNSTPVITAIRKQEMEDGRESLIAETQIPPSSSVPRGMKRHRAIMGACMFLSLGLLAVSCLDLTHLISSRAVVDSKLHVTTVSKLPELPFPLAFKGTYRSDIDVLLPISELTLSGKKFGFADRTGKIVIPPEFSDIGSFSDGLAPFQSDKNGGFKWGFIDTKGSVVIPAKYTSVAPFHSGVSAVEVDGEWRFIDKTGKFSSALKLLERPYWTGRGFVVEETSLRSGFLNMEGKYDLPPEYSRISPLIDSNTDSRFSNEYFIEDDYRDGPPTYRAAKYFLIGKDGHYGVTNDVGRIILKPQFDHITSFSKGHAAVAIKRLFGFADAEGRIVIEPRFHSVTPFDDLIAVKDHSSSKYRLIDSGGKSIPGRTFEDIVTDQGKWLSEGFAAFGDNNKYGYLDGKGKLAIPPIFEFARPFQNGFAVVKFNGVFRFIDKTGRFASPTEFASVENISEEGATAVIAGPLYRFIESDSLKNSVRMLRSSRGLTVKE